MIQRLVRGKVGKELTFQECLSLLAKGGLWKVKHASTISYSLVPSSSHYQFNCVDYDIYTNEFCLSLSFVCGCYGNSWSWDFLAGNLRRCVAGSEDTACWFGKGEDHHEFW